MAKRWYIGRTKKTRKLKAFQATKKPTAESHGSQYAYAVGPFKTKRGAACMAKHGQGNPHLVTVDQAERAGKTWCK